MMVPERAAAAAVAHRQPTPCPCMHGPCNKGSLPPPLHHRSLQLSEASPCRGQELELSKPSAALENSRVSLRSSLCLSLPSSLAGHEFSRVLSFIQVRRFCLHLAGSLWAPVISRPSVWWHLNTFFFFFRGKDIFLALARARDHSHTGTSPSSTKWVFF